MHKLEVIVTSAEEALLAAAGGADRLELVRDLDAGGLTPSFETVQTVLAAVSTPVRIMLRGNSSMSLGGERELATMIESAARFNRLPVAGMVLGWTNGAGKIDVETLRNIISAAPQRQATFHRAFEHLNDPLAALSVLKTFPQIDRILTCGGAGTWPERKERLRTWSKAAAPEIGILVGGGLSQAEVSELMNDPNFPEIHVGRAARTPEENNGVIDPAKIARMKKHRPA